MSALSPSSSLTFTSGAVSPHPAVMLTLDAAEDIDGVRASWDWRRCAASAWTMSRYWY